MMTMEEAKVSEFLDQVQLETLMRVFANRAGDVRDVCMVPELAEAWEKIRVLAASTAVALYDADQLMVPMGGGL